MYLNDLDDKFSRILNAMYSLSVFAHHEQVKQMQAEKKKLEQQSKVQKKAEETTIDRQITPYFQSSKRPSVNQIKEIENVNFKDLDNFLFED